MSNYTSSEYEVLSLPQLPEHGCWTIRTTLGSNMRGKNHNSAQPSIAKNLPQRTNLKQLNSIEATNMRTKPSLSLLALSLVATSTAQNICSPDSVGVGIAPDTATTTFSLIVNSECGLIDSRIGQGELCGTYNQGSKVKCAGGVEGTVEGVITVDGKFKNCVPASEVCYVQPGYAIQWCCSA
ncbi:hypothetical protein BDW69DRAFT_157804 [Aspergillus filifer]